MVLILEKYFISFPIAKYRQSEIFEDWLWNDNIHSYYVYIN